MAQKLKISIDQGINGQSRDHVVDQDAFFRILSAAASQLERLSASEGKNTPDVDRMALKAIRDIQFNWNKF